MTDELDLEPGTVIQDTYRVDEMLGRGGMGATFRGVNLATGHAVAIKIIIPRLAANTRAVDLFKRESSMLRTVQHDAVIRYETTLQDRDGRLYLVMEYADGKSLADYIKKGARLPSEGVLKLGLRLAGGLSAIHGLNIIHRDVAPDNIIAPKGQIEKAKFIDFGLASDTVGTDQSIIGDSFAGKMNFAAPEQFGLFGNKVTSKTDYYALGLVLMKVAGLAIPGGGKGMGAVEDRRQDVKIVGSDASPVLVRTLEMLLKADPNDRPDDVVQVFRDALVAQERGSAPETPTGMPAKDTSDTSNAQGSRIMLAGGGAVAIVAVVSAAAFYILGQGGTDPVPVGPDSLEQAEAAQQLLAEDDPIAQAKATIESGDKGQIGEVLGAMIKLLADESAASAVRIEAALIVARMYDPETFDALRSPFDEPNATAAQRYYEVAEQLGWQGLLETQDRATRWAELRDSVWDTKTLGKAET